MRRGLAWLGGALGLAALWRFLKQEHEAARAPAAGPTPAPDPAAALRAKLDEARGSADDRDEFDQAEGQPLDEVERPPPALVEPDEAPAPPEEAPAPAEVPAPEEPAESRSLDERRRAIHEKAQQALGEMQRPPE